MKRIVSTLMLFIAACIWGAAFVAQSVGMEYIGPLTFNCVRYLIGGLVLVPVLLVLRRQKKKSESGRQQNDIARSLKAGILCGFVLFGASVLQQYGILYSQAGKAGFITTLYIIIVPILGIFLKKRIPFKVWICAVLALIGLYLLCVGESAVSGAAAGEMSLLGDLLLACSAFLFALHIMVIDHYSQGTDGVIMSSVQFFVCGLLSMIAMFLFEKPVFADIMKAYIPLLYAGVLSCGVAYTFQVIAQKNTEPAVASVVLSLESVMAALSAWLILGEAMSRRELAGCAIVFCAIVLIQLPNRKKQQTESC